MTTNRLGALCRLIPVAALVAGCGGGSRDSGPEVGTATEALAPAGSNAAYVPGSSSFGATWFPGERRVVQIAMNNNGATPGTNDWLVSGPAYVLHTQDANVWRWASTPVPAKVPVGTTNVFSFVVTAPATSANFTARMRAVSNGDFGELVSLPGSVSSANQPQWGCTLTSSTIPASMTPGENLAVSVTVQNSGSSAWPASGDSLVSMDTPANLWGQTIVNLTSGVAAGASTTFNFTITAPTTPATYSLLREMKDFNVGGVGAFRTTNFCVTKSIVVGGTSVLNAALTSQNFPATMNAGDISSVTVRMTNTGTEAWQTGGNYALYTQNTPGNLWSTTQAPVTALTNNGAFTDITFNITAPAAGSYTHQWQMRKISGTNAGFFGPVISVPVTVNAGAANYDASVGTQTIPTLMTAGKTYPFSIQMQNSGTTAWAGSNFALYSTNTPLNLWGLNTIALGSAETIAPTASKVFAFTVTAPAAAGTYASSWRMRQVGGVGLFGATASNAGLVVTLCGNSTIDAGEACDDGNLTNNDGCSNLCQVEQVVIDLASQAASRSLVGSAGGQQLGPVTLGDVTGDSAPEIFMSQVQPPPGTVGTGRGAAGAVYGFTAGAAFLNGSTTVMPTGAGLQIAGVDGSDGLGATSSGGIVVGEVTGDSTKDLILSAPGADGASNAKLNCGEVYILKGGAALMTAGLVDLKNTPSQLTAHMIGKTAGDLLTVLGVGELTGDTQPDVLLGAPGDSTNGAAAGALYIVSGGAALTGDIDLAAPPGGLTIRKILGKAAGDKLGTIGAIGDLNGDTKPDILVGASLGAPGGRTRAGEAFAKFGPITADQDFSLAVGSATGPSAAWLGKNNFDGLGVSVAIGNVTGTSVNEAVIGAIQYQRSGVQVGAVTVWSGVTSGTTYDLGAAAVPTSVILGADANDDCGTAITLGDMNNDSFADIIFSCSAADGPGNVRSSTGEVDVVFGASSLIASYDLLTHPSRLVLYSRNANDGMGRHATDLASGDIDGDGLADFCVGSVLGGGGTKPGEIDCVMSTF